MPEAAIQPVQSPQDDENASTPQIPADQPTTVKTSEAQADKDLMTLLDIPQEVQQRVAPKAVEPKPEEEKPPVQEPEENEEPEELEADEAEEEEEAPAAADQPQRVDKRLKRINRLTRIKNDLERQVDHVITENQKLRQQLEQRGQQEPGNHPAPLVGDELNGINREINKCDAILTWCDDNAEGGELEVAGKAQYYEPKDIRAWRRKAEVDRQKYVVVQERELDRLARVRAQSDHQAITLWPEMFDKSKPEYQEAVAIIQKYPFITTIPEANYALGLFIEASRSLKGKAAKNGQQTQKQHRDIDERVFTTPRVPIAPHTAEPPVRESKPSSQKRYNEAMSRLINDPDGGVENLAAALAAREAATRQAPSPRSPVRS